VIDYYPFVDRHVGEDDAQTIRATEDGTGIIVSEAAGLRLAEHLGTANHFATCNCGQIITMRTGGKWHGWRSDHHEHSPDPDKDMWVEYHLPPRLSSADVDWLRAEGLIAGPT
jgi:hypothetical protein